MIRKTGLLLVVMVLFALQPAMAQQEPKGAHMEFDAENYDFGKIEADSVVYHVFTFRNTGTDTLKVRGVRSS